MKNIFHDGSLDELSKNQKDEIQRFETLENSHHTKRHKKAIGIFQLKQAKNRFTYSYKYVRTLRLLARARQNLLQKKCRKL